MNNQQSFYSLMELSPVPTNFTMMPATKITNFFHCDNRPSTLNQLPSQNNIGSAVFDKTEDPKINFTKNHPLSYNPNLYIFDASSQHNLYFHTHNNPETNDFSQQDEMYHLNHKLDSVSILVKKDIQHDNVQQQQPFDADQDVGMAKYNNICTPPAHSNNGDLFGMVQIQPDSKYLQTLTPTQKNNPAQYSPKSNIPTPNIAQAISSASDKLNQCAFNEQQQFQQLINSNNYLQNNLIYSNQNAFIVGKQEYFQGLNNPMNGFSSSQNNYLQSISKNKTHESIKEEMKKRQEQMNQQLQANCLQNSYHNKANVQSTSSIHSQASISSTSSINDQSISNQNNNNVSLKISYPIHYNSSNQMHGVAANSLTSSIHVGSSSHSVGGIYTANKLNIPLSMTTSVNNTIVEEKERDLRDRNQQNSKDSNSDDEGYDYSNRQAANIDMQEFARKVDFCKCKKSKCLKLYCECFLRGNYCNDQCICTECGNNDKNLEEREKAIEEAKTRNSDAFNLKFKITNNATVTHKKGCNCKRTHCLKKYCECYNAGLKCTDNCKCEGCKNTQDGLKMGLSGGGNSGVNMLTKADEDCNSSEINSQMLQSIDYQLQQGPTERKISMCSSTGTSGLQNRKRTRSEVLDQLTSKNEIPSQNQTDQLEPEIRKKKNSLCIKQNTQNSQVNAGSQIKIKNSYQPNQTSYNSFEQNFVYQTSNKNGANFQQNTSSMLKKIQS
ncbi:hypothetical protein ABPG74_003551 [Tetrahymena malaccensis]